ncbi:TonB-dependent receptor plug domain-containing protein [uncultured Alistipes sp.]|uniref:M56 family metallopeptidase n=1 Tax=uncultured Alistipes sp. TaxID=538949 RepID=UPI0025E7B0D9|nr:M56 family metallopeptidase [uncultured Alistipes sp.]
MYDLMIYSLKVGGCLAVFYLFFKLLLSRETFHRVNRFVVLAAMVLSFVLPLCVITIYRELPVVPETLPVAEMAEEGPVAPQSEPFPWDRVFAAVFLGGAGAALLWTLCSVFGVARLIFRGRREKLDDGSVLVRTGQPVTPFSWCRYIVLSEKDLVENGEAIILHEKAHLRLRHSVDLLITDLAGCLQWFNPAMWLLRRELRAIHEYEADEAVLDSGVDAKQYQLLLIRKAAGGRWYSVANSFNHSKLKNRITMMLRKRSSRWAGAKVLFVLPLTGLALGAFARTAYVFPDDKGKKENFTIHIERNENSSSDGENRPLILVNGKEVANLDSLPADRIVSMSVIKDSTSSVSYGEKAKHGVIYIEADVAGTDPKVRTYSFDGDSSSAKVTVRGAGKMPEKKVTTYSFQLDGKRDSTTNTMVWTVDGKEVNEADLKISKQNISRISVGKDGETVWEYKGDAEGLANVTARKASNQGLDAAKASVAAARKVIEGARDRMSAEEFEEASKELEKAQKEIDRASAEAPTVRKVVSTYNIEGVPDTKGKIVSVTTTSDSSDGEPHKSVIRINGSNTKINFKDGEDQPLFVIDGKVQKNGKKLEELDKNGIESISILKDASAVEKYGEKAKNGVVEITTKKK